MFITAIVFFLILSILVFVHEFGHFIVARMIGVKVEEFGFGLPPRIFGKKIRGTIYSINWLPIGGFVKLAGEDDEDGQHANLKGKNIKEYFWARSKKERSAILLAGVTMNFILAVAITTYLLIIGVPESAGRVHIEKVLVNSPAEIAGIKPQDIIKNISYLKAGTLENKSIKNAKELVETVKAHAGEEITLLVLRGTEELELKLTPRKDYPAGEGPTGIAISDLEIKKYSITEAPISALKINLSRGKEMLVGIVMTLYKLVSFQPVAADVAGPIGIAQVTGQAVKFGFKAVLEFASILSLNLAVLNVLPIPALDGGRLAFVFAEKLIGKRIKPAFERNAHQIGMIILLILVVLISINDILRLAKGS